MDSENRGVHVHHTRERNKITKLLFDYIYIFNQNNHGFDRKKKPIHARTRAKLLRQFCAISLQKQAILGEMWQ